MWNRKIILLKKLISKTSNLSFVILVFIITGKRVLVLKVNVSRKLPILTSHFRHWGVVSNLFLIYL
jgi:hypothetical protein